MQWKVTKRFPISSLGGTMILYSRLPGHLDAAEVDCNVCACVNHLITASARRMYLFILGESAKTKGFELAIQQLYGSLGPRPSLL